MVGADKKQTVAAVVVTYNRKELLRQCLGGILSQTRAVDAIYVVDNASTDGTDRMIADEFVGKVLYVRLAENTGSSGGFHYGMKLAYEAGYDWIWVMDDDTRPLPGTLGGLLHAAMSSPHVAAAGPAKLDHTGGAWVGECIIDVSGRCVRPPHRESYRQDAAEVDYIAFPGLLISSTAIGRVGLPRSELFLWYDDAEYCCRLKRSGRLLLVPTVHVVHPGPIHSSAGAPADQVWRHYYLHRNLIYLRSQLIPRRSAPGLLWSTLRQGAGILLKKDAKLRRLRVLAAATFDGFCGRMGRGPRWLHS